MSQAERAERVSRLNHANNISIIRRFRPLRSHARNPERVNLNPRKRLPPHRTEDGGRSGPEGMSSYHELVTGVSGEGR
eukprot:CAMPEP_0118656300 /NCGR_PEP_ID=MMETSP0785-20121206/13420_1 /TAXON_ID=91992 /ORGANISM="Bolidomonas pacifica, Strain CCMP 1866" /LENGTH=77 /DNA_ID=CAMNT_0006549159 /DNA_START=306 /DNA_END=539 /DNA_ORIENTATION=-